MANNRKATKGRIIQVVKNKHTGKLVQIRHKPIRK